MSFRISRSVAQPVPLDHALLHARLAAAEDHLAAGELRLARMRACLARQRAFRLNLTDGAATLRAMEYVQAQWQRQRRMLLDQLWPDPG
ncbi:hypothetical protein [Geminicoccus flavidas]|uniref:hypothetical protein n=1 Tax=Geminicoccus flavidas TaxID=2506407 RepID=UPI00135AE975|nr:hypothetical protein [Geminicoccus flavidas]